MRGSGREGTLMSLAATAVAALAGALLFQQLNVPAGALLGSMVGVAALNLGLSTTVTVPSWASFAAYVVLGWSIGQGVTRKTVGSIADSFVPIMLTVVVLLTVGGLLAWALVSWGRFDPVTAYLAASPGALSQMVALSKEMGASSLIVVTVHTVRMLTVLVAAPLIASRLR